MAAVEDIHFRRTVQLDYTVQWENRTLLTNMIERGVHLPLGVPETHKVYAEIPYRHEVTLRFIVDIMATGRHVVLPQALLAQVLGQCR